MGDRNTRFFQLSASLTNKRKFIDTIVTRKNVISGPSNIKFQVEDFFFNLYGSNIVDRPYIEGMRFKTLNNDYSSCLERYITLEEINDEIWSCDGSKAPRPYGFNFILYIYKYKAWPLIGEEIFLLVSESFKTSTMPKGINNAYITLIPEIKKS